MKRTLACLLLLPVTAQAAGKPMFGGAGYMSQGFVMGDPSGTSEPLEEAAPGMALSLGGGGMALIAGVVALRGQGYGTFGLAGGGPSYDLDSSGGGGGISAGVVVVNARNHLVIPYVGLAGHASDVVIDNGPDLASIAGVDLGPSERVSMTSGSLALDIGANVTRLFWGDDGGGMVLGGELGAWIPLSGGDWTLADGSPVPGMSGAPAGLYMRMNVGGGGATLGG